MAILATVRGLAIAASFFTAGGLANSSLITIPTILSTAENDSTTAQALSKQFDIGCRFGKLTQIPAELFAIASFGFLAFQTRDLDSSSWKLYSAAAAAMFTVIPWTLFTMETDSQKIVSLIKSNHSKDTEPKLEHDGLQVPQSSTHGSITPVEEFEPYEDSPFSGAEYEKMKVKKLLQTWSSRNIVRIISTLLAGALALSAVTTRVTFVTIVQGQ